MSASAATIQLILTANPLERAEGEVAVAGFFTDERPLRGGAARADWRLCGGLSRRIESGDLSGKSGEALLIGCGRALRAPRLMLLGLGDRHAFDQLRVSDETRAAVERCARLRCDRVALAPLGIAPDDVPRHAAALLAILVLVQVVLGAFVAGTKAGLTYNTWPLMDGTLVPSGLFIQSPWWKNLFENVATVQFDHRLGAYTLFAVAWLHAWQARGTGNGLSATMLAVLVSLQAALGIATLVMVVPLDVALTHQLGAVIVLIAAVSHLRAMWPAMPLPQANAA